MAYKSVKKPKLIVMIPAYNEELTIEKVIKSIPRKIEGISDVRVLVIDDGSTDNTSEVARASGADYVFKNITNLGLARAFQKGMDMALSLGADIIVNTDADNQYDQSEIPDLIKPILEGKADIVSGNRQVENLDHMTSAKKYGNIIGSKVVRLSAGYNIQDASSGFRAYNKEAALKLFITSSHTYTHETLIQAQHKNLRVIEVPVTFKKREGSDSKLIKSVYSHIKKSSSAIVRNTLMYNAFKAFSYIGISLIILGAIPFFRWLYLSYIEGQFGLHTQSLLLGTLLIVFGGFSIFLGFIADLLAINRRHLEEILYRMKKAEFNNGSER